MKTLTLLRHAKSSWDDPDRADHDRPLSPRGARAATLVGRHLARRGPLPPLALASTARRAVDTLALVLAQGREAPEVRHERGLYLCGAEALLGRLSALPETCPSVLLVAHNPDLQELILMLAGRQGGEELRKVEAKFPTAALAVLSAPASWSALAPGTCRLETLVTPRSLAHV